MRFGPAFVGIATLLAVPPASLAQLQIDLVSPWADSAELQIGEPATFHVVLSGLPTDDSLVSLSATVTFPVDFFADPAIQRGSIVPAPLADPFDFVSFAAGGTVDATFLTFSTLPAHHIAENGVFYVFELTPMQLGAATIQLEFVDAFLFDAANPNLPLPVNAAAGEPVVVQVVPVPEPASVSLACTGGIVLLARRRARRRPPS